MHHEYLDFLSFLITFRVLHYTVIAVRKIFKLNEAFIEGIWENQVLNLSQWALEEKHHSEQVYNSSLLPAFKCQRYRVD